MSIDKILGVAGVVIQNNKLLLVKRKYGSKKGLWCIPCGKVEPNEELEVAVVREVLEETHLNTEIIKKIHQVCSTHRRGVPYEGTWFLLNFTGGTLQADDDVEDAAFFSKHELPELAFPDDAFVINNLLSLG